MSLSILIAGPNAASGGSRTEPKPYELWYDHPAPDLPITSKDELNTPKLMEATPEDPAWENWSLPIGNGYLGAAIFGRTVTERVQLTENSLATSSLYNSVGLTNFAELYLDFGHAAPRNYRRTLSLNRAVSTVGYEHEGVRYERQYFTSYPDKVLVIRLTASQPGRLSFTVRPEIPYKRKFGQASAYGGRDGKVGAMGGLLTLSGAIERLNLLYEGQFKVIPTGGTMEATHDAAGDNGRITVTKADSAMIIVALGTNYNLESRVFDTTDWRKKLAGNPPPHEKVSAIIEAASVKPYAELLAVHQRDYSRLFDRAAIDLGGKFSDRPTDRLLAEYKKGRFDPYLEELYFNFGRYLLICSSRPGTLPPNLQGIWNQFEVAPWTGGYWHNINIQMNYWPVFTTNLTELFQSFVDYNAAYRPAARQIATNYVKKHNPAALAPDGDNGWTIGTAASAYHISAPGGHSGPGTGAMTTKMFWDYYEFTGDQAILREVSFPAILGMARFLSKVVVEKEGKLLTSPSYSPEQRSAVTKLHYQTVGSAFDQQMIYENHVDALKAAKLLGEGDPVLAVLEAQLDRLDPVQVGLSGQLKEYREEKYYGDLVADPHHRHISHLVGLSPGTIINSTTPAWLDAARESLNRRGDRSTGWAMAHRMNCWARLKEGDRAYTLYQILLTRGTLDNLWDTCPPFQIDGNFGGTAGVAEMLLQSHEGFIDLLPALPAAWAEGSFRGLLARGNFELSVQWRQGHAQTVTVRANIGGVCRLRYPGIEQAVVIDGADQRVAVRSPQRDYIEFITRAGADYRIESMPVVRRVAPPTALALKKLTNERVELAWESSSDAAGYRLYTHFDDSPDYRLVASDLKDTFYGGSIPGLAKRKHGTFRVTAVDATGRESRGALVTVEAH